MKRIRGGPPLPPPQPPDRFVKEGDQPVKSKPKTTDINEIWIKKRRLEDKLIRMLHRFEKDTSVQITDITLNYLPINHTGQLNAKLPRKNYTLDSVNLNCMI